MIEWVQKVWTFLTSKGSVAEYKAVIAEWKSLKEEYKIESEHKKREIEQYIQRIEALEAKISNLQKELSQHINQEKKYHKEIIALRQEVRDYKERIIFMKK